MSDKEILVVDDDLAILDMITELLGYEGYQVVTSSSGGEALLRAKSAPPALILLDLMMPEMNGWQVVAALRSAPQTSTIPVVLVSARRDLSATAEHLGVQYFLEKPFDLDDLLRVIQQYISA